MTYKITTDGRVINKHGKALKPTMNKHGYLQVSVYSEGVAKKRTVHRLVAEKYIPNPNNYPQIDHRDEDKTNNSVGNLRWCTHQMNIDYYHSSRPTKPKKVCVSRQEYLDSVSKPIVIDSRTFTSVTSAAKFIVDNNEGKKIENVRKELRKMVNGKRSYGTIYGHIIEESK